MNKIEQSFLDRMDSDIRIKRVTSENINDYTNFMPKTAKIDVIFGAVDKSGNPMGAITALCSNGEVDVKSLAVGDEYRRKKVGSLLVCKIKDYAAENDINTISAKYLPCNEESRIVGSFFRSNGFVINDAEELIVFDVSEIAKNENYKKLSAMPLDDFSCCELSELSEEFIESINRQCHELDAAYLAPENAKGAIIDDLSLVHISGGKVKAFVITTAINGMLHISTAYAEPSAQEAIQKLIIIMLKTVFEKYGNYEKMCVSTTNEQSWKFVKHFVGTESTKFETITSVAAIYDISAGLEIFRSVKNSELENASEYSENAEFFIPKIWRLTDILAENGIECDMTMLDDSNPGIIIAGRNKDIIARYIFAGQTTRDFVVTLCADISYSGTDAEKLCTHYNALQYTTTAVPVGTEAVSLRSSLIEGTTPVDENVFLKFIRLFREQTETFEKYAKSY